MKTANLFIAVTVILISAASGCAPAADETPALAPSPAGALVYTPKPGITAENTPGDINTPELTSVTFIFDIEDPGAEKNAEREEQRIKTSAEEAGAVKEYWINYSISLAYTEYSYKLRVYEDGTGRFSYKIVRDEWSEDKETIVLDEVRSISKDDTDMLLKVINDNDFWNIPTVHPDEQIGLDGSTISITGYFKGAAHHIRMWEPGEEYGIFKIFKAFYEFGKNIADDPISLIERDLGS